MDSDVESELIRFYSVLLENMKEKRKILENSVFITLIKASQNEILKMLSESSLSVDLIGIESIKKLMSLNLIKQDEFSDNYCLTAQGIWSIEKNKNIVSESQLIDFFQRDKFQKKESMKIELNFREKVLLLSMIAGRSFSKESLVDLTYKNKLDSSWKEIFDASNQFLYEIGILNEQNRDSLYTRSKIDPPVTYIFRRNTEFVQRTNLILEKDGELRYWLKIPDSDNEFVKTIAFLFQLIFGEKLIFQNFEAIFEFCNKIAQQKSVFVYSDISKHKYLDPKYDLLLKEAIIKGIKEYD